MKTGPESADTVRECLMCGWTCESDDDVNGDFHFIFPTIAAARRDAKSFVRPTALADADSVTVIDITSPILKVSIEGPDDVVFWSDVRRLHWPG